jgi:hypothetical protein
MKAITFRGNGLGKISIKYNNVFKKLIVDFPILNIVLRTEKDTEYSLGIFCAFTFCVRNR